MDELQGLLEVLGLDFNKLLYPLIDYVEAQKKLVDLPGERFSVSDLNEPLRQMLSRNYTQEIQQFLEDLLQAMQSMRLSPMYEDSRVPEYEAKVVCFFNKIPKVRYRYIPKYSEKVTEWIEELADLRDLLQKQAAEPCPISTPKALPEWIADSEEILF